MAHEIIEQWNQVRAKRAGEIRMVRNLLNNSGDVGFRNMLVKEWFENHRPVPKPEYDELMSMADYYDAIASDSTGRFGENDTEYYSACGHDDYLSERADAYREGAEELREAANTLC